MNILLSLVQKFLQFFSRFKKRDFLGRNRHRCAGLGVPSFFHPTSPQPKTAEPSNLRLIAVFQRISHTVENRIDDDFRLPFRQGRDLFGYALYIRDPVFILGQGLGLFVYLRNLYFIKRERQAGTAAA